MIEDDVEKITRLCYAAAEALRGLPQREKGPQVEAVVLVALTAGFHAHEDEADAVATAVQIVEEVARNNPDEPWWQWMRSAHPPDKN